MNSASKIAASLLAGTFASQSAPAMTHDELIKAIASKAASTCKDGDTKGYAERLSAQLQLAATPALQRIFNTANNTAVCLSNAMTNQNSGEWLSKLTYRDVGGGLYKYNTNGETKTILAIPEGSSFTPKAVNVLSNMLPEFNKGGNPMIFALDRSLMDNMLIKPAAQLPINVTDANGIRNQAALNPALLNIPSR